MTETFNRKDAPAHTRPVVFDDLGSVGPVENGDSLRYSAYTSAIPPRAELPADHWFELDLASGSDYSGCLIHRSNYNELEKLLVEHHPNKNGAPVVWCTAYGGHGTYALLVRYFQLCDEVRETIDALEDYPVVSDDAHSELELEMQSEAWENWGKREFEREAEKALGLEDWPEDLNTLGVFELCREAANVYWENQSGSDMYIDMKRAVAKLVAFVEDPGTVPSWATDDRALIALLVLHNQCTDQHVPA